MSIRWIFCKVVKAVLYRHEIDERHTDGSVKSGTLYPRKWLGKLGLDEWAMGLWPHLIP